MQIMAKNKLKRQIKLAEQNIGHNSVFNTAESVLHYT